ncbi:cell division protein ZapA [Desulfitispora alkaliphila]|uniref:cell division protein ZapA n=1 Tax=Desulfitispora alkaliphila TaxID=622674 RepID=UPI003D247219
MVEQGKDEKIKVKVEIHGQEYTMKGSGSPEYFKSLADYVNQKMGAISQRATHLSSTKVAVLTALNIADELAKLQEDYDNLIKLIEDEKIR